MLPVTAWKREHCYLLKVLISAQKPISCLGANFYWILKVKQNWTASASPRPMIRQNEIRPIVNHSRFPALIVVFFSLLWYLIGSLECLSFSSLATLVLIPRQPVKERSTRDKITKLKVQHVWMLHAKRETIFGYHTRTWSFNRSNTTLINNVPTRREIVIRKTFRQYRIGDF